MKLLVVSVASVILYLDTAHTCDAGTKPLALQYLNHWDNQPFKPPVFATGTLTVSFPDNGTNIQSAPFTAHFNVKMTANYKDNSDEWDHAGNPAIGPCTVYTFAKQLDGGNWVTTSQQGPDSFTPNPNGNKSGYWQCRRDAGLAATVGQHSLRVELYVSCCCCRHDSVAQIQPPQGYANFVVSGTIQWAVDATGIVSNSDVVNLQSAQSLHVDSTNPAHAPRGDNGWDCSGYTSSGGYTYNYCWRRCCDCCNSRWNYWHRRCRLR
jgi:hypothetical protein